MRKYKYLLSLIYLLIFLAGCGSSSDTVELGEWKEQLQPYDHVLKNEIEEVGENLADASADVGAGVQNIGEDISELGNDVKDAITAAGESAKASLEESNSQGESTMENSTSLPGIGGVSIEIPMSNKSILQVLYEQGEALNLDNNDVDQIIDNTIGSQENSSSSTEDNLKKVPLVRVVDGDTIKVKYNGIEVSVRLIGVNTPESVHPDEEKNTEEGTEASYYTEVLVEGLEYVWLEFDEKMYDAYGRLLAYVWTEPDTSNMDNMLNVTLLENGYAELMEIKPNIKYAEAFAEIQTE